MPPQLVERTHLSMLMDRGPADPFPDRALVLTVNGGGARAANYGTGVMLGLSVMDAGTGATALEAVDAFSSVSGGNLPVLRYLDALSGAHQPHYPSSGEPLASLDAFDEHLSALRTNMDFGALLRWRPWKAARLLDKKLGMDADRTLEDFVNQGSLPGWIPNSVSLPSGQLIPMTQWTIGRRSKRRGASQCNSSRSDRVSFSANLAAMASSAVPGAIPPVAACLWRGPDPVSAEVWLADGGWTDRMGLTSAFDLVTTPPDQTARVVLTIDSRPQPQYNQTLPPSMRWDSFAAAFGRGILRKVKRRVQLIATGLELMRYHTDSVLMGQIFGTPPSTPISEIQRKILEEEEYTRCSEGSEGTWISEDCSPDRFGLGARHLAARAPGEDGVPVSTARLGGDVLLQTASWGIADRPGFSAERVEACERIAARLFTVVAVQPTDLSLSGAYLVDEDVASLRGLRSDGTKLTYPYSRKSGDEPERQGALVAAGLLTVYLQAESLHGLIFPSDEPFDAVAFEKAWVDRVDEVMRSSVHVNFRSAGNAEDWYDCTGLGFPTDPKGEWDKVADNCEDRSRERNGENTRIVVRTLPPCADHPEP